MTFRFPFRILPFLCSISPSVNPPSLSSICLPKIWILCFVPPRPFFLFLWSLHWVAARYVSTHFFRYCVPLLHNFPNSSSNRYTYPGRRAVCREKNHCLFYHFLSFLFSALFSMTSCKMSHLSFHSPNPSSTNDTLILPTYTALLHFILCLWEY